MDARPIPKPAMPCSVNGVLKTRSRPVFVGQNASIDMKRCASSYQILQRDPRIRLPVRDEYQEPEEITYHCASEHTPKGNILAEDDRSVIFRHCNAALFPCHQLIKRHGRSAYIPHRITNCLIEIHFPRFPPSKYIAWGRSDTFVQPSYTW